MDRQELTRYQGAVAPPLMTTLMALGHIDGIRRPIGYLKNGTPVYPIGGGSVDGFIQTVWSAKLLQALRKAQVFAQDSVVNRDYEGEIKALGDSVRVGQIGDVTINDYTKNTDISGPETLTDAQTTLVIDHGKYFNFQVDDVDKAQIRPALMSGAMSRAAYQLKDGEDQYIAGLYTDAQGAVGTSGSPKTDLGTVTNAYVHLVELGQTLDEQNVPTDGRWVVVPPWYHSKLLQDDRFVKSGAGPDAVTLANGQVGEAAGFRIFKSNNVSHSSTHYRIMAGIPDAISFAEQINEIEAYRPEKRFADAVKGLLLYGAKVMRPDGLAVLYADQA